MLIAAGIIKNRQAFTMSLNFLYKRNIPKPTGRQTAAPICTGVFVLLSIFRKTSPQISQ